MRIVAIVAIGRVKQAMPRAILISLVAFLLCAHTTNQEAASSDRMAQETIDILVDGLCERALKALCLHLADLDVTALGKSGHGVSPPRRSLNALTLPLDHGCGLGNPREQRVLSPRGRRNFRQAGFGDDTLPASTRRPWTAGEAVSDFSRNRDNENHVQEEMSYPDMVRLEECKLVEKAAELATTAAGRVAPHPWAGCVLATIQPGGVHNVISEAWQEGQGGKTCEELAVNAATASDPDLASNHDVTVFLNLEPAHGDVAGTTAAVDALVSFGVKRVVVGIASPLPGLRLRAVSALRAQGIDVNVLDGEDQQDHEGDKDDVVARAVAACRLANTALLHRVAFGLPFSILKYAMTLDGKIATDSGNSVWVSGPDSRRVVHLKRSHSDCVIVGGNTVRYDNPQLTTRSNGHQPTRVILSRKLDLPLEANVWNVTVAPTLVLTLKSASQDMKRHLKIKGVQVVEFEKLTPRTAMEYCYARGFLQCFWECGGTLAAPAVIGGVIHRAMAFVAPKFIGTTLNRSPMGNLEKTNMSEAIELVEPEYSTVAKDLLVQGYVPPSAGLVNVSSDAAATANARAAGTEPARLPGRPPVADDARELRFYKAWDTYGALSNFARFPIQLAMLGDSELLEWPTVEHFYQAHKFDTSTAEGKAAAREVRAQVHPESAAKLGREAQRVGQAHLRKDFNAVKERVMRNALRAKFLQHKAARELLVASGDRVLMEDSPHDTVWGVGWDHSGDNRLGWMLMELRAELRNETFAGENIVMSSERADEPCGEHDCVLPSVEAEIASTRSA